MRRYHNETEREEYCRRLRLSAEEAVLASHAKSAFVAVMRCEAVCGCE